MVSFEQASSPDASIARLLAVDDHAPFLTLVRELVDATNLLELVGEARCGEEAVEMASGLQPDVVLMDVRMPGLGGINAARQIRKSCPSALIVLISTADPDELPLEGTDAFADAVIHKGKLGPKLLDELWLRHLSRARSSLS